MFLCVIRPGRCLNGIVCHYFADTVERRQSLRKLGDGSSVLVSCAESGSTLVLIRCDNAYQFLFQGIKAATPYIVVSYLCHFNRLS